MQNTDEVVVLVEMTRLLAGSQTVTRLSTVLGPGLLTDLHFPVMRRRVAIPYRWLRHHATISSEYCRYGSVPATVITAGNGSSCYCVPSAAKPDPTVPALNLLAEAVPAMWRPLPCWASGGRSSAPPRAGQKPTMPLRELKIYPESYRRRSAGRRRRLPHQRQTHLWFACVRHSRRPLTNCLCAPAYNKPVALRLDS